VAKLSCVLLPLLALACGGSDRREPAGAEAIDFSISQHPVISVGLSDGDEAYQLFKVRSAFQLESGVLVVASDGTHDLRFYDAQGRHIRTVGRRGRGPGEFELLWYARAIHGDTIVVWDVGQRRASFFDPDGDLTGEVTIDLSGHFVEVNGLSTPAFPVEMVVRRDGFLLIQPGSLTFTLSPDGTPNLNAVAADGAFQLIHPLFLVDRDGSVVQTVGPVPGSEWFIKDGIRHTRFFGAELHMAGGRETFVVGAGKPSTFSRLTGQNDLQRVETGMPEVPLSDAAWEERLRLAMPGPPNQARADRLRAMPKPATLPAYSALLVDDEDRVWVQEFDAARSSRVVPYTVGVSPDRFGVAGDTQRWAVFDRNGRLLGRLTLPTNLRITDIARGRLTAVDYDELGVERVQVFELQPK
jgi:hypothetical protein